MTPPEAASAPADFALLTDLRASKELWVERAAEAETLAGSIAESPSPIVVLLGPARAGKTELLRRWVIPFLSRSFTVSYRDSCEAREGSEDDSGAEIEFWDSFELCLTDERIASGDVVAGLSRLMERRRKVVLCLADEFLSRLFQLCGAVPQIRGEVLQIPLLEGARVVQTLQQTASRYDINLGKSFTEALAVELDARPTTASIGVELVAVLVFQLHRSVPKNRELQKDDYVAAGGLNGLLEAHLDFVFERMPDDIDPPIGWAVVQEIVTTGNGAPLDLDDVARRFGVAGDAPWRVVRYLEIEPRVLRAGHGSDYSLVPVQIVTAIEDRMRREAIASEHIRAALYQGARNFAVSEALLSRQSFKRVHGQRTAIKVSDEEATLMLRCALAYEDPQLSGAIDYWLQRIIAEPARVEVLFDALFDTDDGVRQRAVKRLGGVKQPEIWNQVHLLALRDASQDVRTAAVDALDSIKDDQLKRSLLQEINESNSPYRLQAIEALRVFKDPEVTDALVDITRKNAPGEDAEARLAAISVLGIQNTTQAADALLDIALTDTDGDDRAGAASALSSMTDEGLLARMLEKLRELRRDATRFEPSFSARAVGLTAVQAILAALVVGVSVYFHGLTLLVIKRWRLAMAVLACEVAGLALGSAWQTEGWVLVLFATSLSLGILIPTRILLRERLDFKLQPSFRRCLSGVLFAFCSVTFFLYFHGLASMLARRVRRGLVLLSLEVLGILFLMSAFYLEQEFAGLMTGVPGALLLSFKGIGVAVLVVTGVTGIGTVLLEAFVHRNRQMALQRIDEVCGRLLQSPAVSAMVFRGLAAESREGARWAKELVNRFGERMQEPLRRQWRDADVATQRRIFAFLAKRRDAGAVQFLQTIAPSLGAGARLRAFWAGLAFRFSVWPLPLLVALALVLYAQVAIAAGVLGIWRSQPGRLVSVVEDESGTVESRSEAVSRLTSMALQRQNHDLATTAAQSLVGLSTAGLSDELRGEILDAIVLVAQGNPDHEVSDVTAPALAVALEADQSDPIPDALKQRILEAIVGAVPDSERPGDLVKSVASLLGRSGTERQAIDALRRIGSPDAALALANFARDRTESVLGTTATGQSSDQVNAAARRALDALKRVEECGEATVRLLTALGARSRPNASVSGDADRVARELLEEVASTAKQLDPLSRAEYYLTEERYDEAIVAASAAQAPTSVNDSRRLRAKQILQRAHVSRGTRLLDKADQQTAKADEEAATQDLFAALKAGTVQTVQTETVSLGLRLAYQFHEFRAPQDPQAHKHVYEILTAIAPLAQGDLLATVRENLAEASLTTGRYDQAIGMAQEIAAQPKTDPSSTLAMKYILFAAWILKGDRPRADAALADLKSFYSALPEGFSNTWSYAGTKRYVEREAPDPVKPILLETLAHIESERRRP